MAEAGLPSTERVRKRRDFARVQRAGLRASGGHVVVLLAGRAPDDAAQGQAGTAAPRLGIVASRRVGGAVVRNRAKRLVREWFRRCKHALPRSVDLLVILKPGAAEAGLGTLAGELDAAIAELRRRAARPGAPRRRSR
jgi:ribonuclease P protein component